LKRRIRQTICPHAINMQIEWHNEKRKVKDLIPASYNPRILLPKDRQDLEESINKFNEVEPVIINISNRNNVLIGGHQRVTIYADLEKEEIDVRVPNRELTIEEETELNLRLNKNTGSWDWGKLKEFEVDKLLQVGFGDEVIGCVNAEGEVEECAHCQDAEYCTARFTYEESMEGICRQCAME